jgi:hypothetical protein
VLAGGPLCIAKRYHDRVGMIRTLRVAPRSAIKMRTQVANQMRALMVTGFAPSSASRSSPRHAGRSHRSHATGNRHDTEHGKQAGAPLICDPPSRADRGARRVGP